VPLPVTVPPMSGFAGVERAIPGSAEGIAVAVDLCWCGSRHRPSGDAAPGHGGPWPAGRCRRVQSWWWCATAHAGWSRNPHTSVPAL